MNNNSKIGERIKKTRLERGLTLQELGQRIGLTHASLSNYESGNVPNIPINRITDIAKALEVDPSYLMGWNKGETPQERLINKLIEMTQNEKITWEYIKEPSEHFTKLWQYDSLEPHKFGIKEIESQYKIIEGYLYEYDKGFYYLVVQGKFLDIGVDIETQLETDVYDYSTHLYASNKQNIIDLYTSNTKETINHLYEVINKSLNNPEIGTINDLLQDLKNLEDN